ncbi:hypothetical protein CPHO_10460 [Corynebacterium phocae]|uniref:Peptidase S1 domain-containing protein n=1 Tax=Corynebacterium phocae TaxID=161895 RepID=A0A1L7D5G9_9CORY|nr:trypsin-like serine protease [Corynebacterium phocae]APT93243.1 hypothetical protein CPHO_10460 [Corynebacterium phocae]KAA8721563.1 S1 family peptidase [Corynebacterium phocae]
MFKKIVGTVMAGALLCSPTSAIAQETQAAPDAGSVRDVMSSEILRNGEKTVVNQGDRIQSGSGEACTIGYIDKNVAYTAAHCFDRRKDNKAYNEALQFLGEVVVHPDYDPNGNGNDLAVIKLADTVTAGSNGLSGNIYLGGVYPGDSVCSYGVTTGKSTCGKVIKVDDSAGGYYTDAPAQRGDSGGPAWIPGKGFIGVVTLSVTGGNRPGSFVTSIKKPWKSTVPNERVKGYYGGAGEAAGDSLFKRSSDSGIDGGFINFLLMIYRVFSAPFFFLYDAINLAVKS